MGISYEQQLYALLYAVLTGCILGCILDVIRISRVLCGIASYTGCNKTLRKVSFPLIGTVRNLGFKNESSFSKSVILFFGDLLFFALSGCVFCVFLFHAASGCFRWFYILGALAGFFAYYVSVGRMVMMLSETINIFLNLIFLYLVWLLRLPFRAVFRFARFVCRLIAVHFLEPIWSVIVHAWRIRYTGRARKHLCDAVRIAHIFD